MKISPVLGVLFCAVPAFGQEAQLEQGQRVEKAIPVYKDPPKAQPVIAGDGYTVVVDPMTATVTPVADGVTKSLQQQVRFAIEQVISPFFSIKYVADTGYLTQETDLIRQEKQQAAYWTMLQRPALSWKPHSGTEVEVAYEKRDHLNDQLLTEDAQAVRAQATTKLSEKQSLRLTARNEERRGFTGEESSETTIQMATERSIGTEDVPLKLQIGPGYQRSGTADSTENSRVFVDGSVVWQVDSFTSLSVGRGMAGSGLSNLRESVFIGLQHRIFSKAAIELRAASQRSWTGDPAEAYSISAASTVALAEALSAGLSVRYQMGKESVFFGSENQTFLSLSINGKF
ncbi:MAG TPA: hypothetical protein VIT91_14340 [Chthoniobacterales bacterium]